eukprot:SAG11_NODE_22965_length_397_cov_0.942953_1_plen_90_part_10
MTTTTDKSKGQRIARWCLYLSDYNYVVKYLKGADNSVADLLSRLISVPEHAATRDAPAAVSLGAIFAGASSCVRNAFLDCAEGSEYEDNP